MGDASDARSRIQNFSLYVAILSGLTLLGGLVFGSMDGMTADYLIGVAGSVTGILFVVMVRRFLDVPSAATLPSLGVIAVSYGVIWLAAYLVSIATWGGLDPVDFLGISIVLVAVYLMIQTLSDARKLAAAAAGSSDRTTATPEGASSSGAASRFCPNCGAPTAADAKFCRNCGTGL